MIPGPCDIPGVKKLPQCKLAEGVSEAVDFARDPFGYMAQKMQEAAAGLAETVLPAMADLTEPDLNAKWFLDAYKVSFALAILLWVGFLGWNFVQLARHRVSGDEVAESLWFYTPAFFLGVIFGPLAGTTLLSFTGAITDSLIAWGVTKSTEATTETLQKAIDAGEPSKIVGGSIVAIIVFFCMIVALLLAFITLLIMTVALYLGGAVFPLSAAWLVNPRQRSKGLRIAMVFVGIACSHVLLFLMLGLAFKMIAGLTDFKEPGLQIAANLVIAVIALLAATLSPLGLLAFAPVGPSTAGGGGPSLSVPSRGGGIVGGGYAEADDDSQAAQMARDDPAGENYDDDGGAAGPGGGGGGGLLGKLAGRSAGGQSSAAMESSDTGGVGAGAGSPVGAGVGARAAGSTGSTAEPGADAAASAGGEAGGGVAGSAAAAGEGMTSAGAAADATGVGVPVGVALAVAGQAVAAAGTAAGDAASQAAQMAQSAGDMAGDHMDHAYTYDEGD